MAIQTRRGFYKDFDPYKMLPGEFAVSVDPSTEKQVVWICFAAGVTKRMGTYEDFYQQIFEATQDIKDGYIAEFNDILSRIRVLATEVSENKDTVVKIKSDILTVYIPQIEALIQRAETAANTASTKATAASTSATAAQKSESNAKTSETAAKTSETAAKASESASKTSETNAATSASTASTKATAAANSATASKTSETNAKASEDAAKASQTASKTSETNASTSASTATSKATEALNSATAAKYSETNAKTSETNAKTSETAAKESQTASKMSETNAAASATTATEKATSATSSASAAKTSETNSKASETAAKTSQTAAKTSETNAAASAVTAAEKVAAAGNIVTEAASYAHGGTGTRTGENTDNAQYYYQQSKSISEGFAGALRPMGTVTFANLPIISVAVAGDMYNVSDQFTTTAIFKEGTGNLIPAGANIYKTADGYWDVLAGSPVVGVKGNVETSYRRGNVNITPANIGLGKVDNTSDSEKAVLSASKLSTARTIALSGGATGTATSFNGDANISIPVTALDATKLSGTASINTTGSAAKLTTARTIKVTQAIASNAASFDGSSNIEIPVTSIDGAYIDSSSILGSARFSKAYRLTAGYDLDTLVNCGYYDVQSPSNGVSAFGTNWHNIHVFASADANYITQMAFGMTSNNNQMFIRSKVGASAGWGTWYQVYNSATPQTTISGNSGTATKLQTARTINGVSFDGTANITVADSTKLPLTGGNLTGTVTAPTFSGALSGNATTATKATLDSAGQQINTTYVKGLSVSGKTITYTKGDGSAGTITTQDTTYSAATSSTSGLMSNTDKSKLDGIAMNANNYSLPTATSTVLGGVKVDTSLNTSSENPIQNSAVAIKFDNLDTTLSTMQSNFQAGCNTIATAITAKGVSTPSNSSPATIAANIAKIQTSVIPAYIYSGTGAAMASTETGNATASASVTLLAGKRYVVITVANAGVGSGYNLYTYPGINWTLSGVTASNTSGTVTNKKNSGQINSNVQCLCSYRVDEVTVSTANSTFTASATAGGSYKAAVQINIIAVCIS